jgi:hypothetical protein
MKNLAIVLLLVFLAQPAGTVWANTLPDEIGYTIYQRGQRLGHCDIKVTESAEALVLESTTKMKFGSETMELTCRTEADPETYLVRRFEYFGTKAGTSVDGFVNMEGDSIWGTLLTGDVEVTDYRLSPLDRNLFLEDYVMDHEVLAALAHSAGGSRGAEYGIVFPSNLTLAKCGAAFASKQVVESDYKSAVCEKLLVHIEGSDPFASYFDPKRNLPVYIAFPQTNVEVFLDEFYGDSPVSQYRE